MLDDYALALIAEAILEASDDEILSIAREHGVDVDAIARRTRAMIAARLAIAAKTE